MSCNGAGSQPFDVAYDQFNEFIRANESAVLRDQRIHLPDVWTDWSTSFGNYLPYLAKHIGCRIAEAGFEVPPTLIAFLDGKLWPPPLSFRWEIRIDMWLLFTLKRTDPGLWVGALNPVRDETGAIVGIWSHLGYRYVRVNWVYDERHSPDAPALEGDDLVLSLGSNWTPRRLTVMSLMLLVRLRRDALANALRSIRWPLRKTGK